MEIVRSQECVASLVAPRQILPLDGKYVMFITISPNPKTLVPVVKQSKSVKVKDKKAMKKYEDLRQVEQYEYCLDYVRSVYMKYTGQCRFIGAAELNGSGNIHLHILFTDDYVDCPKLMEVFRRDIKLNSETQRYIKHVKNGRDFMNNIVELTKPLDEVIEYMSKDFAQTGKLFPNFYSKPVDHVEITQVNHNAVRLRLA